MIALNTAGLLIWKNIQPLIFGIRICEHSVIKPLGKHSIKMQSFLITASDKRFETLSPVAYQHLGMPDAFVLLLACVSVRVCCVCVRIWVLAKGGGGYVDAL